MCQTNSKAVASMLALKSFKDDARRNWKGRLFDNMAFVLKRKLHLKLSAITFLGEIWMVPFWSLWGFFLGVLLRGDKTSGQDPHNRGTLVYWFAWQFVMLRQKHSNATGADVLRASSLVPSSLRDEPKYHSFICWDGKSLIRQEYLHNAGRQDDGLLSFTLLV